MDTTVVDAGYDLDLLIGQQVMGWTIEEGMSYWPNTEQVWRDAGGHRIGLVGEWAPSTEWDAAGDVIEHFAARHRYLWLSYEAVSYMSGNPAMHWKCSFAAPRQFQATGETPMLAICRAALKAKALLT